MGEGRYNIALLPPASVYSYYQSYAQEMFGDTHGPFLLGPKSLPHITLCQFHCADPKHVQTVYEACKELHFPPYIPQFYGLSLASKSESSPDLFWIGLMVMREAAIVQMHRQVKHILEKAGLSCINKHGEGYRPHLTLANAYLIFPFTLPKWPQDLLDEPTHAFSITLGIADEWGQFICQYSVSRIQKQT